MRRLHHQVPVLEDRRERVEIRHRCRRGTATRSCRRRANHDHKSQAPAQILFRHQSDWAERPVWPDFEFPVCLGGWAAFATYAKAVVVGLATQIAPDFRSQVLWGYIPWKFVIVLPLVVRSSP